MNLAFFGDVVGRSGRRAIAKYLPRLRKDLRLDVVVVNGENAAGGFGITEATANEIFDAGADIITLGNHSFDNMGGAGYIEREARILRPVNYPKNTVPGRGSGLFEINGYKVLVVNVLGRVFMDALDCPFAAIESELLAAPLGEIADAIIIDIHAEATSEKQGMGHFCDGRASLVVGTHQHVPTADTKILPDGTGFQTDAGMCGDYFGVIGMEREEPLYRFTRRMRKGRFVAAKGEGAVCGVFVKTDDKTGLALRIEPVRIGVGVVEHIPVL